MAKEEAAEEAGKDEAKGSKKTLFIIIGVVVLLLAIGAAAFVMMGSKEKSGEEAGEEEEAEEAVEEGEHGELPAAIMPLEPFIVNLQVKGSFLKTSVQLEFAEPEAPKSAENDLPKIRDAIIRVLSAKSAQEILSVEGKENLRNQLKQAVNTALGSEDVSQIYFTEFIIQ